jgi:hypothetical protein
MHNPVRKHSIDYDKRIAKLLVTDETKRRRLGHPV